MNRKALDGHKVQKVTLSNGFQINISGGPLKPGEIEKMEAAIQRHLQRKKDDTRFYKPLHKTASQGRIWSGHRSAWTGPVTYKVPQKRSDAGWWFLLLATALFFYVWRLGC